MFFIVCFFVIYIVSQVISKHDSVDHHIDQTVIVGHSLCWLKA